MHRDRRIVQLGRVIAARPTLVAAAIYAVLALVMFGQGVLPGRVLSGSDQLWASAPWAASAPPLSQPRGANPELFDSALQFEPFRDYSRERLPHPPLWNPHIMGGRPYLANAQSALLSPFNAVSYVLPRRVSPAAVAMLKVLVAAFGTFLFARTLGLGFAGALLSGLIFGFGQFTVTWVTWPEDNVRVLLPWLLLLTELVMRRPRALPTAGLATLVALQFFGGHPETSYYVVGTAVAFALFRLFERWRAGSAVVRPALAFAGALALGTALAAIAIVPFIELLQHSSDLTARKLIPPKRLPGNQLLGLLLPDYWGRATETPQLTFTLTPTRALYAGALPLMLAAGSLLRPSLRRVALAAGGIATLAVLFGVEPFWSLANDLPGPVRTDRVFFLFLLAVALLAGLGLGDLLVGLPRAWPRRVMLGLGAALLCFPLVYVLAHDRPDLDRVGPAITLAWGFHAPTEALAAKSSKDVIHLAALLEWLPVAAAGVALLALRSHRRMAAGVFATLALALTAGDLFKVSMGYNPAVTVAQAFQPATGAIKYLQQQRPARFAAVDPAGFLPTSLPANVAMRYGLYDARGYDFPVIERYTILWTRNIAPVLPDPRFTIPAPKDRALRALGLMSVADLLQDPRGPPLSGPALRLAYNGADARIYHNDHALPRAFVVDRQRVVTGDERVAEAVESPSFDGHTTAITEKPLPGVSTSGPAGLPSAGTAAITSYEPERVEIRARASRPSVLVLTDAYFPGWDASVDGHPTAVHRVDYLLRGIRLPPGAHEITFSYQPASFRTGWIVSLVALVGVLALAFRGWRSRGREKGAS